MLEKSSSVATPGGLDRPRGETFGTIVSIHSPNSQLPSNLPSKRVPFYPGGRPYTDRLPPSHHTLAPPPSQIDQSNNYPIGSGAVTECGSGEGADLTINVALPAGSGSAAYALVMHRVVVPAFMAFKPDLVGGDVMRYFCVLIDFRAPRSCRITRVLTRSFACLLAHLGRFMVWLLSTGGGWRYTGGGHAREMGLTTSSGWCCRHC